MWTTLLRLLSALGLSLALTGCATSSPAPGRTEPAVASLSSLPSPVRVWREESRTTRTVLLTLYDDDSARLLIRGPAESVPNWGELRYPEKVKDASAVRAGDRMFLIFYETGYHDPRLEVAEIVERSGDRLVMWFHHDLDFQAEIVPQLAGLPRVVPSRALELVRVSEPDQRDEAPDHHTPATHFLPG